MHCFKDNTEQYKSYLSDALLKYIEILCYALCRREYMYI